MGIGYGQTNFAEEIEPVYREYLKLLLSEYRGQEAWKIAELLTKFELESYFGDNCFTENSTQNQPQNTAIIRSIIFEQKTYLMLRLPSKKIKIFENDIAAQNLNNSIERWRIQLELPTDNTYRIIAEELYKLLLEPIESDLSDIDRLVFTHDGLLKTIPMAVLYDGREHLIERYSIAYALGSGLEINKADAPHKILAFGLSETRNNLNALPQVRQELWGIRQIIDGDFFLDRQFTTNNLVEKLNQDRYSILHLATHSSFEGELNNIYLQTYDRAISLSELEQILQDERFSLQLLVLSSCETAIGNEDALLGLAGIGIRAGAESTIGSIWAVNSASTVDLFVDFYGHYSQKHHTASSALRKAQLKFVGEGIHPYYWSGFINIY